MGALCGIGAATAPPEEGVPSTIVGMGALERDEPTADSPEGSTGATVPGPSAVGFGATIGATVLGALLCLRDPSSQSTPPGPGCRVDDKHLALAADGEEAGENRYLQRRWTDSWTNNK